VEGRKLASVGLRVRRSCSYHGLALNVNMDLEPFHRINPCGFRDLEVTQLADLGGPADLQRVGRDLSARLLARLGHEDR
jgi:lipoyl(octanoyl) transferase